MLIHPELGLAAAHARQSELQQQATARHLRRSLRAQARRGDVPRPGLIARARTRFVKAAGWWRTSRVPAVEHTSSVFVPAQRTASVTTIEEPAAALCTCGD